MATYNFYKDLKSINNFLELSNDDIYERIPNDWHLLATDVKESTKNIEKGKYKEINMIGAMCIVSILNLDRELELPYVFGGDGAFILIPRRLFNKAKNSLLAVKKLSKEAYDIELRVGSISLEKLSQFNKNIFVAKYKINENHSQALLKGNGLEYFDELLKLDNKYHFKDSNEEFELDLEGLECRWSYIESPKDETLSLILKCFDESYYKEVLEKIESIVGNIELRHPIDEKRLKLSFKNKDLKVESSLLSNSYFGRLLRINIIRFINFLGLILIKFNIGQWGDYKKRIISTTDIEKYENIVKMVFSVSKFEKENLERFLNKELEKKKIVYGIHTSKYALMTCLIFERHGRHIHFVDTSDGGYAYAAKEYKKRMSELNNV